MSACSNQTAGGWLPPHRQQVSPTTTAWVWPSWVNSTRLPDSTRVTEVRCVPQCTRMPAPLVGLAHHRSAFGIGAGEKLGTALDQGHAAAHGL